MNKYKNIHHINFGVKGQIRPLYIDNDWVTAVLLLFCCLFR